MAEPSCTVDTNVILRYLLADEPQQYRAAQAMMSGLDSGQRSVFCDPVILAETVHVLRTVYKLTPATTAEILLPLVQARGFLIPDKDRYVRALGLFATTVPHFGDACACAAALVESDGKLYSFDRKLSSVEGVTRLEKPAKAQPKGR